MITRRHLQLVPGSVSHRRHIAGGSMDSDLDRLIDVYTGMRPSSKVAFKPQGARVLKAALSHLRLTPPQVAELDRWLKTHNGSVNHPRRVMIGNRDCLRTYLQRWRPSYEPELRQLATTVIGLGYHLEGWESMTLCGFFLACHVIVRPPTQTVPSSNPNLRLL
jgi:hypothetical protein